MKSSKNYWFTIEPFVYVGLTNQVALLYNTLDGELINSNNSEVIYLLNRVLLKDNHGVALLTNEECKSKEIKDFIEELRDKYMGDVLDTSFSKYKPVQLFPYSNYQDRKKLHKKINFFPYEDVLENLFEVSIYLGKDTDISILVDFLRSMPRTTKYNILGDLNRVDVYEQLFVFLDQSSSTKYIWFPYTEVAVLPFGLNNNFSFIISIDFPLDKQRLEHSWQSLINQDLPFEYVFNISSVEELQKAGEIVEMFDLDNYRLNPIYTGTNIQFLEENVFLTKDDILSNLISLKDIFTHQSMNVYNYGKLNIMSNGDVYANVDNPPLGNICTHSILDMLHKELAEGKSWFHLREQSPCVDCVYQWLCPSPSELEKVIGRPNLCHVK